MAEARANLNIGANTSEAVAAIKNLQRQISSFYTSINKNAAASQAAVANMQQNLINSINTTGQFSARIKTISTTTESFTNALEKNKLTMGQYFRYAGAASGRFGRKFTSEINTIDKVARERVKDLQTQYIQLGRDANGAMKAIAVRPATLDLNNFTTQTQMAAQKQAIFNQLIQQGSTNLLNWGKNTQWAGRQLMVGFTIPLTIFATQAGRAFMQLEEQAIKFKRVYGDLFTTGAQTEEALAQMRALGDEFTKFGVAVEETVGLAATVAQMGKTGADLTAQVTEATRLSVLGGMSQEEALDTTIGLTNAFGVSVEDLTNKVNFLNAAENQTILSIQDFNEAVPRAGSVVSQLGGDVEDLAFFMASMREGGIEASQAANALKSSLGRLINPTMRARDRLKEYGIDVTGIVERNTGDLRGTVMELAYALDELEPLEKSRAIETLFGKFQFARMSTLFQNIIRDGSQASTILDLINSSASDLSTIAGRELGRVEESAATKFTAALERFQAALAPLGEEFLKLATPIIEWATDMLKRFNNLGEGAKGFIVALTAGIGGVMPVMLMLIGLTANLIANIVKGLNRVRIFFQRFRKGTNDLASQTEYLNAEQLESQTIASALQQSHQNLTQSFNLEADALERLRSAYERATASQRAFRGDIVTGTGLMAYGGKRMGPPIKAQGYNSGVVSVPGSGNTDTVPAMLTPGEAVIPKEMAKRYAPLINAMIAGNIPGYRVGKPVAAHGFETSPSNMMGTISAINAVDREFAELRKTVFVMSQTVDEAGNAINRTVRTVDMSMQELATNYQDSLVFASGQTFAGSTVIGDADRNQALQMAGIAGEPLTLESLQASAVMAQEALDSGTVTQERYTSHLHSLIAEAQQYENAIENGANAEEVKVRYTREIAKQMLIESEMAQSGISLEEAEIVAQRKLNEIDSREISIRERHLAYLGAAIGSADELVVAPRSMGTEPPRQFATGRGYASGTPTHLRPQRIFDQGDSTSRINPRGMKSAARLAADMGYKAGDQIMVHTIKGLERGINKHSQSRSPSRATNRAAQNMVAGAVLGLNEGRDDAQAAGQQVSNAFATGAASGSAGAVAAGAPLTVFTEFTPLGGLQQIQAGASLDDLTNSTNLASQANKKNVETTQETSKATGGLGKGFMGASFALTGIVSAASMAGGKVGEMAQKIIPFVGAISGATIALSMLRDTAIGVAVTQRLQNAKNLAGSITATTALGRFGQKLARGGRILVGFLGAAGPVVAGLAALGGVAWLLYSAHKEAQKEVQGLADAANLTAGQLEVLKDLLDIQETAESQALKTEVPAEATEGMSAEDVVRVEDLLNSEEFLKEYETIIKALSAAEGDQARQILQALAFTLNVTTDASEEAIETIVAAVKSEAGKTDLELDFASIDLADPTSAREVGAQAIGSISQFVEGSAAAAAQPEAGIYGTPVPTTTGGYVESQYGVQANQVSEMGAEAEQTANTIQSAASGLQLMFNESTIGAEELSDQMIEMRDAAKEIGDEADRGALAEQLIGNFGLEEVLGDVEDLDVIFAAIEARLLNVGDFGSLAAAAGDPEEIERLRQLNVEQAINNRLQKEQDEIEAALDADVDAAVESLEKQVQTYNDQNDAYETAIALGYSEAEAKKIASSASLARGLAAAAEADAMNGTNVEVERFMENYNAMMEAAGGEGAMAVAGGGASGGGGQPDTSPFDQITESLRKFADAQVSVTSGFEDTINEINEFLNVSSALQGEFGGLNQELRGLGLNENLIEMIVGMDPEEYEKRKNDLFIFDDQGTIIGMTAKLQGLNQALNTATIGEFVNEQNNITVSVGNQVVALQRLTAAGASYQAAYRAVQNTALAAAIATAKSSAQIQAAAEAAMRAQEMMDEFEEINEEELRRERIRDAIVEQNREFSNQAKIIDYITRNTNRLSEAQKEAILGDKDLQALILEPGIAPGALQTALDNANRREALELEIKKLTITGQQEIWEDGLSKAMEAFSAQEQELELKFQADTEGEQKIVQAAQEEIERLQFQLDDYEAGIEEIEDQEDLINEVYDKRVEALEDIEDANERITRQQEAQLNIAEALSRGDIAAAAQAAQEARALSAENVAEERQERLEKAREAELARTRSRGGMSRDELQTAIRDIENQIFRIEEDRLEPAEEAIRLADVRKQADIEALTVLGKTKTEWEEIGNRVDLAVVSNYKFVDAMKEALDIVEELIKKLKEGKPELAGAIRVVSDGGGGDGKESKPVILRTTGRTDPFTGKAEEEELDSKALTDLQIVAAFKASEQAEERLRGQLKNLGPYAGTQIKSTKDEISAQNYAQMMLAQSLAEKGINPKDYSTTSPGPLQARYASDSIYKGVMAYKTPPEPVAARTTVFKASSGGGRDDDDDDRRGSPDRRTPSQKPKPSAPGPLQARAQEAQKARNRAIAKKVGNKAYAVGMYAMGGFVRRALPGPPSQSAGYAGGGFVRNRISAPSQMYFGGGRVSGPGTSTSDSIPALLSDGEYVINAKAVDRIGVPNLDRLNNQSGKFFQQMKDGALAFARGGRVSIRVAERRATQRRRESASAQLYSSSNRSTASSRSRSNAPGPLEARARASRSSRDDRRSGGSESRSNAGGSAPSAREAAERARLLEVERRRDEARRRRAEAESRISSNVSDTPSSQSQSTTRRRGPKNPTNSISFFDAANFFNPLALSTEAFVKEKRMPTFKEVGLDLGLFAAGFIPFVGPGIRASGLAARGAARRASKPTGLLPSTSVSASKNNNFFGRNVIDEQAKVAEETAQIFDEKIKQGIATGVFSNGKQVTAVQNLKDAMVKADKLSTGPKIPNSARVSEAIPHIRDLEPRQIKNMAETFAATNKNNLGLNAMIGIKGARLDDFDKLDARGKGLISKTFDFGPSAIRTSNQRTYIKSFNPLENWLVSRGIYASGSMRKTWRSLSGISARSNLLNRSSSASQATKQMIEDRVMTQLGPWPRILLGAPNSKSSFVGGSRTVESLSVSGKQLKDNSLIKKVGLSQKLGPSSMFLSPQGAKRSHINPLDDNVLFHEGAHIYDKMSEVYSLPKIPGVGRNNATMEAAARAVEAAFAGRVVSQYNPYMGNIQSLAKAQDLIADYAAGGGRSYQFSADWFASYRKTIKAFEEATGVAVHTEADKAGISQVAMLLRRMGLDRQADYSPAQVKEVIEEAKKMVADKSIKLHSRNMAMGGYVMGSDTIPAMLTRGEYIIKRPAVESFGVKNLDKINNGTYNDGSVYNYNLSVNVKSDSNPDQIARTVMDQIKRVDSQRIRGNRF